MTVRAAAGCAQTSCAIDDIIITLFLQAPATYRATSSRPAAAAPLAPPQWGGGSTARQQQGATGGGCPNSSATTRRPSFLSLLGQVEITFKVIST